MNLFYLLPFITMVIFSIQSYMEEVFSRAENQFSSLDKQISWLSSFERPERGSNAYTKDAVKVRDELLSYSVLKEDIGKVRNLKEISSLQKDANSISLSTPKGEALGLINDRIRILEGEADEYANTIKTSRNFSEVDKAVNNLREISPQKLGGIKSGQVRFRGSKKEQKAIGEALGFMFENTE